MKENLIEIKNLRNYFFLDEGILKAVDGVSFSIQKRKTLGLIGESGCGKSVTAQSIMRIVPKPGKIIEGEIIYNRNNGNTIDLIKLDPIGDEIRGIRGKEISMIFQEPMTSLSPVHSIGFQIMEAILLHKTKNKNDARDIAIEMLAKVGIPDPYRRIDEYPHNLSGGLRQRAMIAMALSCNPYLLIADEPTTALDVTVQAQILDLIQNLKEQYHMSVLYITHDLGVVAEICEEVAVMYLGKIVEYARVKDIFNKPLHPYTRGLLKSIPRAGRKARKRLAVINGTVPVPLDFPDVCGFRSRCQEFDTKYCKEGSPSLIEVEESHFVRCYHYTKKT